MFLVEISLSDSLWFAKKSYLPWTLVLHLQLVIIWQYDVIFFLKSMERYQSPGKDGHGLRGSRNETINYDARRTYEQRFYHRNSERKTQNIRSISTM
jgi:hypothetical protein